MDDVSLLPKITIEDVNSIVITRLNQRYEPLLELAKLFLNQQGLQFLVGEIKTHALIINMNQLFERFIINFIRYHRSEILAPDLQECQLISQGIGINKYLANTQNNQSVFLLKPDLAFKIDNHFPLLLDTKYKILKTNDRISSLDFYQMYAYANRYNCPMIVMIYPQIGENPARKEEFPLQGSDKIIRLGTLDLRKDLSQIHERQKLIERLKELLQK